MNTLQYSLEKAVYYVYFIFLPDVIQQQFRVQTLLLLIYKYK